MFSYTLNILLLNIYVVNSFGFNGLRNDYQLFKEASNINDEEFDSAPIQTNWIEQPLDHFDDNEKRTWKMRYLERNDMWKSGGPIYLFISYGEADSIFLKQGFLYEFAKETNGVLFISEYRYYGESKPLKNLTVANMIYLSTKQALADNARLIETIKLNVTLKNSKVVVIGDFLNLVAWMKLKYPTLIDAAIASSASALAKVDFYEYFETVNENIKKYGSPECVDKIAKKFQRYADMFETPEGIAELKKEEMVCDVNDFTKPENRQEFFKTKAMLIAMTATNGYPKAIADFCTNFHITSKIGKSFMIRNEKNICFDYRFVTTADMIKENVVDSWPEYYQYCNEFGFFSSTNSNRQPFTKGIPLEYYYKLCMDLFGADFDKNRVEEGVRKTNEMYGGLHPNVTHVIFVSGEMDPRTKLAITQDLSADAPAKVIPGVSGVQFLLEDSRHGPKELKETRKYVKNLIKKWISAE